MAAKSMRPILYNYFLSSASWRVRIALCLKNINYEYRHVNITKKGGGEQLSEEFKKLNPIQEVPVLFIDNTYLVQSLPIIEYLDETRPIPNRLLPNDPINRAHARAIAEVINSGIQPLQNIKTVVFMNKSMSREKRNEWLNQVLDKGMYSIESMLKKTSGQCCVGDSVSIADLCLVPQVEAVIRVKKAVKKNFDLNLFPNISRVNHHLEKIAAFQEAHATNQPGYRQ